MRKQVTKIIGGEEVVLVLSSKSHMRQTNEAY